ncbi:MAG: hypothetical protein ABI885_15515, partial [Gammaproteobacteria bacterium]
MADEKANESDRQRAQGGEIVESKAIRIFGNNKKKHAIIRVCQLRMIGWLKLSPPVPSAGRFSRPAHV